MNRRLRLHTLAFESLENRRVLSGDSLSFDLGEVQAASGEAPPVRVLQLGDSLTSGISPQDAASRGISPRASYRPALWDLIQTGSVTSPGVEFVGTSTYNATDLPTEGATHSGYRGFATYSFFPHSSPTIGSDPFGEINNDVRDADGWGTLAPDIATVMLGTNDLRGGRLIVDLPNYPSFGSIETSLRDTVEVLREGKPDVTILLGTLPPYLGGTRVEEANAVIRNLVNADAEDSWAGATEASPIHIVDHFNGEGDQPAFDTDLHLADSVHPNEAGEALLAANWWSVLQPIIDVGGPPPPPTVVSMEMSQLSVAESSGMTKIVVSRSGSTSESLTVDYSLSGTATMGKDYRELEGEVVIPAGQTQASIVLDVIDDDVDEPVETIGFELQATSAYQLSADTSTMVQLLDNDDPPLNVVSVAAVTKEMIESDRGIAQFRLLRTGDLSNELVVRIHMGGTAQQGADYANADEKYVIPAGTASVVVDLALRDDVVSEGYETIVMGIGKSEDYNVGQGSAEVSIMDDDNRVNIQSFFTDIFRNSPSLLFRMSGGNVDDDNE